jgi:hypothetical protein
MTDNTAMPDEGDANPDQAPETPAGDTYEVGYGKPPKHTRFKKTVRQSRGPAEAVQKPGHDVRGCPQRKGRDGRERPAPPDQQT